MRFIFLLALFSIGCAQTPNPSVQSTALQLQKKIQDLKDYEKYLISEQQYYAKELKMNRLSSLRAVTVNQEKSKQEIGQELLVVRQKVESLESELKNLEVPSNLRISSQELNEP